MRPIVQSVIELGFAVTKVDCILLGGGAAGLMCSAVAAQRGRRVVVLDHANKIGRKILMSGGGRCNFTNYYVEPSHFLSNNPHFCKSALKRYSQYDFLQLVGKYQLAFHEKTLGQLFCDNKSSDILNILLSEAESAGVEIVNPCQIHSVSSNKNDDPSMRFVLETSLGQYACESLVIATGGLSIPTMGASGLGYDIAKQFGLAVTELVPSLVPFTLSGRMLEICQELAGVSMPVSVSTQKMTFDEALLFTHRGLSGPAILQISNYWQPGERVHLNFIPAIDLRDQILQWQISEGAVTLKNLLVRLMPKKFVQLWLELHKIENRPIRQLDPAQLDHLVEIFHRWPCIPGGTEGYRTAEVTRGGVATEGVSSKTFEAKKVPGLFFIGEVLDVTGWLGGFNFQWAWSSGYCAGQYI